MYQGFLKRLCDIVLSIILLIVLSPIILVVAILIKLDSEGPVLFKQIRSGKDDVKFEMLKFRSMSKNNDVHNLSQADTITKLGKILRKTSLDEIPQLINILNGDMSFIGPRPWILDYSKYFTKNQRRRLVVKPGLTGYAQCSGRNNLSIKDKINLDIYYVDNVSLSMDIKVLFRTIKSVLINEGNESDKFSIKNEIEELKAQWQYRHVNQIPDTITYANINIANNINNKEDNNFITI